MNWIIYRNWWAQVGNCFKRACTIAKLVQKCIKRSDSDLNLSKQADSIVRSSFSNSELSKAGIPSNPMTFSNSHPFTNITQSGLLPFPTYNWFRIMSLHHYTSCSFTAGWHSESFNCLQIPLWSCPYMYLRTAHPL